MAEALDAGRPRVGFAILAASPAVAIFLATNLANAGNLAFNMAFSRLLVPAAFHDLAVILTLKLALLSVLGAVQMAVSQLIARGVAAEPALAALARLSRAAALLSAVLLPLVTLVAFAGPIAPALGLGDRTLLPILLLALPVTVPLCLARGAALGRMSVGRMVWSANLEMAVRLVGALLVHAAGLGLPGIVAAVAASLLAGWWPVRGEIATPSDRGAPVPVAALLVRVGALAWPFALLQLAQVVHLDGDVLLAAAVLTEDDAGLVAGLSLIQRIQFYACFGLAGVLLPAITAAARDDKALLRPALPVMALLAGTGALLGLAALLQPQDLLFLLAGPSYGGAASALLPAVAAAFCFTATYLSATFLAALGDRSGIAAVVLGAPVSLVALSLAGALGGLDAMIQAKAALQGLLCLVAMGLVLRALRRAGRSRIVPSSPPRQGRLSNDP